MTDAKPTSRKPVFIEKIFPVKLLNQQVYYEHGGNPFKGLHRWYSRKPLSFSRASVLGSILPEGVTIEEFEYLLGVNRRVGGMQDTTTKLYKTPPSADRIAKVHDLCEGLWGTRTPTVLDAFAGGGSIPFEAARYGLNVLASDLNPVAVVTMKAAIEYPLKFGPDLQVEIDKWVKWVGEEAKVRLGSFFPSQDGETVVNYLWAHTVVCPSCESVVPLSPNWWLYKRPEKQNLSKWCAVRPVPNLKEKRVDFELVRGKKGKSDTIVCENGEEYDPSDTVTIGRGVGKCPCCGNIIETESIYKAAEQKIMGHQLYSVAFKTPGGSLQFRIPNETDLEAVQEADNKISHKLRNLDTSIPVEEIPEGFKTDQNYIRVYSGGYWSGIFNSRQLLTLVAYVEIINEAKLKLQQEQEPEKVEAIMTYLTLVLDRCVDHNSRLSGWHSSRASVDRASKTHALNLTWNYPEIAGTGELWHWCADAFVSDYANLCNLIGRDRSNLFNSDLNPLIAQSQSPSDDSEPAPIARSRNDSLAAQIQAMAAQRNLSYDPRFLPYNKKLVDRAKDLRKNMTAAEKKLWHEYLKTLGDRFWRQRPIDHFIVDFYCPSRYLVIEVDGGCHGADDAKIYDAERTQVLEAYGLQVLRFSNDEVLNNFEKVCAEVEAMNLPQPPFGRGEQENPEVSISGKGLNNFKVPLSKGDLGGFNVVSEAMNPPQPPFERGEQESPGAPFSQEDSNNLKVPLLKGDLGGFKATSEAEASPSLPTDNLGRFNGCTIISASADNLTHIANKSIHAVVTDPPYYATIQYSELSDFFYVWQKRTLGDIFPELYWSDLTDKDREAVANPSRFRNMGISPEELANQDYEAKMALAFAEYHRVLRDDGVMTVQFNHKDSGAWDTLAKSLIDSGFEITASWAVSTENPQNLHQAAKNSVSSTVLLVCRKRDPNAGQAWWDDLRPLVTHLVETRAPEFEANDIDGIDLYLSAFGPALNIFSRNYPILDTSGKEVRPEQAFAEARKAIANYRFHKLAQTDTAGFDPITTWYILAWDAFRAREFPFDEARQLALAVGGFNLMDLHKIHKLAEIKSGNCKLLTPDQRLKKRAFSTSATEFAPTALIDSLHAIIALYIEEGTIDPVRRFLKSTDLLNNDLFMRAWEVTLQVIPRIGDERKRIPEEKALADLWLAMDEIKAKVRYVQPELELGGTLQGSLF
jgi:adenine-specific DNA methylase/very-short-patch-repair endonuclease